MTEAPAPRDGERKAGRRPGGARAVYAFLVSPRLAIGILVVVLGCCITGVTVYRGARAGEVIFSTLWFNGLLVLLAVSSAAAFFTRIWRRKLTLVQAGMIVFHVSFAALLGGVVYDRMFFFDGVLRLTEGETLPNGRLESYDRIDQGRFFDLGRLRGETTLVRMHRGYEVDGENKRAAYEVALSDGDALVHRVVYVGRHLDFDGARFFCQVEGYSILLVLSDRGGEELGGGHVPLQSYRQPDGQYRYAAGTSERVEAFPFPPPPDHPRVEIQLRYRPNTVVDRAGDVMLDVAPLEPGGGTGAWRSGTVEVGTPFDAGAVTLTPREIRYWVAMNVRYNPGLPVILGSLVLGTGGMVMTFVARLRQSARLRSA